MLLPKAEEKLKHFSSFKKQRKSNQKDRPQENQVNRMGKGKDRANKPELSVMVFPQQAREGRQEEASYRVHHPHETNAGRVLPENQNDAAAVGTQ